MCSLVMDKVGIDQSHNLPAQRPILFKAAHIEDLKPDLEIGVADEKGRILLVTVSLALQEPALIRIGVFWIETRIDALYKVPGQTTVDPRATAFAKDEPGFAAGIPDDMLPIYRQVSVVSRFPQPPPNKPSYGKNR